MVAGTFIQKNLLQLKQRVKFLDSLHPHLYNDRSQTISFGAKKWYASVNKKKEDRDLPIEERAPAKKTGSLKDNLELGYKSHANAVEGDLAHSLFIPKIK